MSLHNHREQELAYYMYCFCLLHVMEEESYSCSFYTILNVLLKGARTSSIRLQKQPRAGKHKANTGSSPRSELPTKVNDPTVAFRRQRCLDEEGIILCRLL